MQCDGLKSKKFHVKIKIFDFARNQRLQIQAQISFVRCILRLMYLICTRMYKKDGVGQFNDNKADSMQHIGHQWTIFLVHSTLTNIIEQI